MRHDVFLVMCAGPEVVELEVLYFAHHDLVSVSSFKLGRSHLPSHVLRLVACMLSLISVRDPSVDDISACVTPSSAKCLGRDRYLDLGPFLFERRNKRNIRSTYQTPIKWPQHPPVDIQDPPVSPGVQISGNSYDRTHFVRH
jgi:hypothetical protein